MNAQKFYKHMYIPFFLVHLQTLFILNRLPIGIKVAPGLNESQPELESLPQEYNTKYMAHRGMAQVIASSKIIILHKIQAGTTHISEIYVQRRVLKRVFEKVVELLLKGRDYYGTVIHVRKKNKYTIMCTRVLLLAHHHTT